MISRVGREFIFHSLICIRNINSYYTYISILMHLIIHKLEFYWRFLNLGSFISLSLWVHKEFFNELV